MKFGGGLLTSGESIRQSARLVKDELDRGSQVVVVVSAMKGVTDLVLDAKEALSAFSDPEAAKAIRESIMKRLRDTHRLAVEESEPGGSRDQVHAKVTDVLDQLDGELILHGEGAGNRRRSDLIAGSGERLSAPIFASALNSMGSEAIALTGGEAGIVTDSSHGSAKPKMDLCEQRVTEILEPLLKKGVTPIVTGFIAVDEKGAMTTLGRGGSDYTASILGACLDADEIWIWKDVGGIMTADPRLVPGARTIPVISYSETAELAHFGAEVLHPRTMEPARDGGIPIRVKGTANPDKPGTVISEETMKVESAVKAVTSEEKVGLLSVSGTGMVGLPGVAARVLNALARGGANVMMISQSSSETNITIVVRKADLPACKRSLGEEFEGDDVVKEIAFDEEVCIVSVVGSGMKGTPGVASKVFKAVADARVNVSMIAQGSSEVNISFVVRRRDAKKAVVSIHKEFRLDEMFPG